MPEPYSPSETDLKIENSEHRMELVFRKISQETLDEMRKMDHKMDLGFALVQKEMTWFGRFTIGTLFAVLAILLVGAVKWYFH
jgi:hypothetical protein